MKSVEFVGGTIPWSRLYAVRLLYRREMSVTVPEGLSELLEEFAVTVLREKPKDLLAFAAGYFNDLNMSRKQGGDVESEKASTATTAAEIEMGEDGRWCECSKQKKNKN